MNTRSRLSLCVLSFCSLSIVFPSPSHAAPTATEGWKQLWQNKNVAARATFRAAIKQNPADFDALRGLGLLAKEEDDSAGALQAWTTMIRQNPTHPLALSYWIECLDLANQSGGFPALEATAKAILKSNRVDSELRTSARLVLAEAADRAGLPAEAEKQWASLKFIRQWNLLGPFDNVSRSGFTKAFAPETGTDFGKTATGKDNVQIGWNRHPILMRSGQCVVGDSLGGGEAEVSYAATAVVSPVEQPALLCFDPEGASKLFLNGTCVFSDEKYRKSISLLSDPYQIPVTLKAGVNTLLVKIATENTKYSQFRLRLTRTTGDDLPGLSVDPQGAILGQVGGNSPTNEAESHSVSLLRKLSPTPETLMRVGEELTHVEDYEAAAVAQRKALSLATDCGWLHWCLSQTLAADSQHDDANTERDLAMKNNSRLIEATLNNLTDTIKSQTPAELLQKLKGLLAINPKSALVNWKLFETYGEAKQMGKAFVAARVAYDNAPGDDFAQRYIEACTEQKREKEAEATLALALKASPLSYRLLQLKAERFERNGQTEAAIALYRKIVKTSEYQSYYQERIASLYRAAKQWKSALAAYQFLHQMRPQDSLYCSNLADVTLEVGRKTEAVALYREAIRLQPSRVELRDRLQIVTGEKPMLDLIPTTPVPPLLAAAKTLKADGAPATYLLDEKTTVVYPDYATVSRFHQIVKIHDEAGVKRFETLGNGRSTSSSTATYESARLIKANGKIEKLDVTEDSSSITFPSLAAGDIIDYVLRIEDYPTGALGRNFWSEWRFDSDEMPSRLSRFVLITPPDMEMKFNPHGTVPTPTDRMVKGWRVREWKRTDLPAFPSEAMAVSRRDSGDWLDISTFHNWGEIVRWYQDLSGPLCLPDNTIKEQAAELTRNATTETEKIRALVAYTAEKIRYQSGQFRLSAYVPTQGKQVLREHYGDCKDKSALLVAMLSAIHIPADMVLLSGREYGTTPYLPSPRFTHAITRIHTSSGELWVDATADKIGFGILPYPDQQVPALVISPETTDLVLSPAEPVERSVTAQTMTTKLDATGKLTGDYNVQFKGNMGWMIRSVFASVSPAQHDQVLRSVLPQLLPDAEYESGHLTNLEDQDAPLLLDFRFHNNHYGTTAGNFLLAHLPWNFKNSSAALLANGKRRDDLEMAQVRGMDISDAQMEIPAGYEIQDLKPEVKGECPYGSYRFTYRVEGNRLIARCEHRRSAFRVPASDLKTYLDYLDGLAAEGGRQLVLKKAEGAK